MSVRKRKICVVTGSRADYGLLYWLMQDILADEAFSMQLVVTGMHLSPEFGMTVNLIEADGFDISARVETLLSSDNAVGIGKSVGLGVIGFSDVFARLQPDLIVLLGDRFEIFAAAQTALYLRLPVVHIGGGDVTEGAFDEAMRHSISKLSHLHFVTNEISAKRLARMGENPARIFNVGSPGLDILHRSQLPEKNSLEKDPGIQFRKYNFLITFHPVTLDVVSSEDQLAELLQALDTFNDEYGLIFTMPNADTEGRVIMQCIKAFVARRDNAQVFVSLGQTRYLGTLAAVDVVIGNSSSGLYEAPSVQTPTVNIGDRQKGRLRADSVFDCPVESEEIIKAIKSALAAGKREVSNPYQVGDCAQMIVKVLHSIDDFSLLVKKSFFESLVDSDE